MWTTIIKSKTISNGLLQVAVEFTDGTTTFIDRYETRSGQESNWLNNCIAKRITDLDGVNALANTITLGAFTPVITTTETVPTAGKALYAYRLDKFEKMVSAIRKGLITENNATFIALKTWLKNNYQDDYIDLL